MDTKLIAVAGKMAAKRPNKTLSLEDWSKLWTRTLDRSKLVSKDPETLAFLRSLIKGKEPDRPWLDAHLPWTTTWPEPILTEGVRHLGSERLDNDILKLLDTMLLEVGDGKVHRRFLRGVRELCRGTSRPLLPETLRRLANHYPLTQCALDYLAQWEKKPQAGEGLEKPAKPFKKQARWPWKPIALGFLLAALVLALIYLIVRANLPTQPLDPQPSPSADLPQPQLGGVVLPEPPSTTPEPESPAAPPRYTVQKGDSLSSIAQNELADLRAWPRIQELNRHLVTDPDFILPGWDLELPRH